MGASTAGAVHVDSGLYIREWMLAIPLDLIIDVPLFT